jgi:hypothetical protein
MNTFTYDGIPSDLITELKEGSSGLKVVQSTMKPNPKGES